MAQGDYLIQNQTFPSFRTDLNSTLEAINTSNSGTSRPSSAVAGTVWLDTTSATTPTLKFYDGADDISLATFDYSANTVNWLDSTVVFDIVGDTTPQLGGDLDVNGNSLVSTSNGDITFTPNGSGKVVISGLSFPTADGTADQVLKTDGSGNLSFTDVSGGTSWQSVQTTGFTAVAGEGYPCNTTSAAFTVTLPSSASVGDSIQIVDYAGTFATNNITLTSSLNIEGGGNKLLTTNREGVTITYADATQGWVATSGVNSGSQALDPIIYSADFLVIAGGGAGGYTGDIGGGGGAGGYRNSYSTETSGGGGSSETSLTFNTGTVYTITVGAGGTSGNGGNSVISGTGITTITSLGGGVGGTVNGVSGGSGSGSSGNNSVTAGGAGTANQGYGGGFQANGGYGSSGGGGAGAVGQASSGSGEGTVGGNGGNGVASSITGSSITRGGGGGGGDWSGGNYGAGGSGGGGTGGGTGAQNAVSGTANTGGGGGGASSNTPVRASGGSGVVILRMPTANYSGTVTGAETPIVDGSDTILVFNGDGSYTG
jgi:hypothetical protein